MITLNALVLEGPRQRDAQRRADHDPDQGAEDGQDHRFRADHRPDLSALHADGTQQADLVGPFEDREHQRVDDPDQGDDHSQAEQRVDQAQQLVHLRLLRLLELGPGLDPQVRVVRQRPPDARVHPGTAVGLEQHRHGQLVGVEVGHEEPVTHQVLPDQRVGLEHAPDPHGRGPGLGELDRHHVPVEPGAWNSRWWCPPGGRPRPATADEPSVMFRITVCDRPRRGHRGEGVERSLNLELALVHRRGGGHTRDGRRGGGHRF